VSETLNSKELLFGSEPCSSAGPVRKNHPCNEGCVSMSDSSDEIKTSNKTYRQRRIQYPR
jgi:hypothetical protein